MPTILTRTELSKQLNLSPTRISELHHLGILPRQQDGKYSLEECRSAYRAYRDDLESVDADEDSIMLARAKLTATQAKQTYMRYVALHSELAPGRICEVWHLAHKAILSALLTSYAPKLSRILAGKKDAKEIGMEMTTRIEEIQNEVYEATATEKICEMFPDIREYEGPGDFVLDIDGMTGEDALKTARLAKLEQLTALELLKTDVMSGKYVPTSAFLDIAGGIIGNCKSRLTGVPTKLAPQLAGMTADQIFSILQLEFTEVVAESLPFDSKQYSARSKNFVLSLDNNESDEVEVVK
jgi:phage terminase Nu1 subunit (DNA packaging protein)